MQCGNETCVSSPSAHFWALTTTFVNEHVKEDAGGGGGGFVPHPNDSLSQFEHLWKLSFELKIKKEKMTGESLVKFGGFL